VRPPDGSAYAPERAPVTSPIVAGCSARQVAYDFGGMIDSFAVHLSCMDNSLHQFVRVEFTRFKAFKSFRVDLKHFNIMVGPKATRQYN
jgi:hypothetical protein